MGKGAQLLFLSNLLPPHSFGGYEEWCSEVATRLAARGYAVHVLTSRYGQCGTTSEGRVTVQRVLYLDTEMQGGRNLVRFFTGRARRERANLAYLRQAVGEWQPEAVVVWGMWNLARSLPALAEALLPGRTVYYFGDYWPILASQWQVYWQGLAPRGPARWLKRALQPLALRQAVTNIPVPLCYPHALFASEYLRSALAQAGVQPRCTAVIPGGVDLVSYHLAASDRPPHQDSGHWRLLAVGRMTEDKGFHTAIEALALLREQRCDVQFDLTLVGAGDPAYQDRLCNLAQQNGVGDRVCFAGRVPKERMPGSYLAHDVLVFPSIWPEPFGRVLVEAMAAGLPVVGTGVGGSSDILQDTYTGLLYPPGDASMLASQILRLVQDNALRQRLTRQADEHICAHFDIQAMVTGIEQYLLKHVMFDPAT